MTSFSISPRSFLRVAPFIARNDIHYYLNGILVERDPRGGAYIVSTDGNTMVIERDPLGVVDGERVIIRCDANLQRACRYATRATYKDKMRVQFDGQRLSINAEGCDPCSDTELYVAPGRVVIEGNYPDWRRLVPKFDTLKRSLIGDVNIHLLARFAKVSADQGANANAKHVWTGRIVCWQSYEHSPIAVQMPAIPSMLGIVMPMWSEYSTEDLMGILNSLVHQPKEAAK